MRTIFLALATSILACSSADDAAPLQSDAGNDSQTVDSQAVDSQSIDSQADTQAETGADAAPPTALELPGDKYYPESLHAASDGTLYVGSLGTGKIVKFAPGSTTPVDVLPGGDPKGVAGVFVSGDALWVCAADLTTTPPGSEVRKYTLAGEKTASLTFSQPAFCNDFALDGAGNLFVADSFGVVWKLAKGGAALEKWKSDPLLQPSSATGFGADGIAIDGSTLYVTAFSDGRLLSIPIQGDGTAGAVTQLTVTPKLGFPDGMRLLSSGTLILADGTGALVKVAISGAAATATTLATDLAGPTSVVKVGDTYWVSEGQLGHLTGALPGAPSLPFHVRAVR
jgi:sugar lactone lactonase YvrE